MKRVQSKLTEPWEDQIQQESEEVMELEVAHNTVASCVQKDPYSEISFPRLLFQRGSKCSGLDRKHQNLQIRPL